METNCCSLIAGICTTLAILMLSGNSSFSQSHRLKFNFKGCFKKCMTYTPHIHTGIIILITKLNDIFNKFPFVKSADFYTISLKSNSIDIQVKVFLTTLLVFSFIMILIMNSLFGAIVGSIIGFVFLSRLGIHKKVNDSKNKTREMPYIFRTISTAMASGASLSQALFCVAKYAQGDTEKIFAKAAFSLQCGISEAVVLNDLQKTFNTPGMNLAIAALRISQTSGASPSSLLEEASKITSDRVNLMRELEVKTAQSRMSAQLITLMPLMMIGFLMVFSPDYLEGASSAAGAASLLIALGMDIVAWLAIKHFLNEVTP